MTDKAVRTRKRPTSKIDIPSPAPASSCNRFHEKLKLVIEYVDPESLTPPARKLRKHSPRQIAQIIASVRRFGFIDPVLVDANKKIICGYGRWIAACELGMVEIPVIDASHLSDEQRRLYAIAENQLGAMSEWDLDELKLEFGELLEFNLDLNIELTGFTTCDIDQIVAEPAEQESPVEPEVVVEEVPVTRLGDLWALGGHRLFCGDAQEKASYQQLMGNELAQMAFCDPPFNTPMRMISGKGRAKHKDFAMAAGEMVKGQFTSFLTTIFMNMVACSMDGAIHFQCMDWRHSVEMQEAGARAYRELKNLIVWNKGSGGMGTF
ncbi:ParB/Srx family N-terminal domain-containing protein [Aquisediminimonas sediminicola]|uniref:ParB/Srx family N-terminal domain-containing protein n=1 Tax=Alteraquisediminimonas sediminicola TaxID=2676787 RepID=UPI001FE8CE3E|nr:ParB/Srx family N-terminal domain-containing protein [Aquisediminimonas sediminicola]